MSLRRSAVASYRLLLQRQAQQRAWGCHIAGAELCLARRASRAGCPSVADAGAGRGWQGAAGGWQHLHVGPAAHAAQPAAAQQAEEEAAPAEAPAEAQARAGIATVATAPPSAARAAPDLCDEALSELRTARSKAQSRLRQQFAETSWTERARSLAVTAFSAARVVVRSPKSVLKLTAPRTSGLSGARRRWYSRCSCPRKWCASWRAPGRSRRTSTAAGGRMPRRRLATTGCAAAACLCCRSQGTRSPAPNPNGGRRARSWAPNCWARTSRSPRAWSTRC